MHHKPSTALQRVLYYCAIFIILFLGALIALLASSLLHDYGKNPLLRNMSSSGSTLFFTSVFFMFLFSLSLLLFSLFMHKRKEFTQQFISSNHTIQNSILFLLVLISFLIVGEISLRLLLSDDFRYSLPPGQVEFYDSYVQLNSHGYRDTEHSLEKNTSSLRIVGIGDSFTFGIGMKNPEELYLKQTEKMLNQEGEQYESINLGIPGIDTEYESRILAEEGIRFSPDFIIVGYVLNDFRNANSGGKIPQPIFLANSYLMSKLYTYSIIHNAIISSIQSLASRPTYEETLLSSFSSETNIELNRQSFSKMAEIATSSNATIILVIFPLIHNLQNYSFTHAHDTVSEIAKAKGMIVIDLLQIYQNYDERDLRVSTYDEHPNALAHKLAAEQLSIVIREHSQFSLTNGRGIRS